MNRECLRKLSLKFRRISSNFLNSNMDTVDVNLKRFVKFIDENEFISGIIKDKITGVEYDFRECFSIGGADRAKFNPPEDEKCHIKAQYDYLLFICNEKDVTVKGQVYCFRMLSNDGTSKFLNMAFKPLIDFIIDQISMEIISFDEKAITGNTYIQNIHTLNGSASQQNNGVINTCNSTSDTSVLVDLVNKLLDSLTEVQGIDPKEIENVKDDLEIVQEQLKSENPKKNRIRKAIDGIKKFLDKFSVDLAVSLATRAVTGADWEMLLQNLENLIK